MLNKLVVSLGGLFLMFVLVLAAGLGVWAYGLNTQLSQTQADLQALKSGNEKINTDYGELSAALSAAQTRIDSLQSQLKAAQADNDSLKAKITAIQAWVSILYSWEFGPEIALDRKVDASDDAKLKTLWATYQKTESDESAWEVMDYIVQSIADMVGLNMLSTLTVNGA